MPDIDRSNRPETSLAHLLAKRLPPAFFERLRLAVDSGYDESLTVGAENSSGLPYFLNVRPHLRNERIAVHLHSISKQLGMDVRALRLDNSYWFTEIRCAEVCIHVKHFTPWESVPKQLTRAQYRRQSAAVNRLFGQQFLDGFEPQGYYDDGEEIYVVMVFADAADTKERAGDIFFAMPHPDDDQRVAYADLTEIIGLLSPEVDNMTDFEERIDLPPRITTDDEDVGNGASSFQNKA